MYNIFTIRRAAKNQVRDTGYLVAYKKKKKNFQQAVAFKLLPRRSKMRTYVFKKRDFNRFKAKITGFLSI